MSPAVQVLLTAAGVATALGVLWRFLHLGELITGTRLFLLDWLGQPERPGSPAVASFPERMAKVEKRTADLAHDFRGELTSRLTLLAYTVDATHERLGITQEHLTRLDTRVTDHRRRNDEQIQLLREAVARTEQQLVELRTNQRRRNDPHPEDP